MDSSFVTISSVSCCVWYMVARVLCVDVCASLCLVPTSQAEGAQAAVCQLDVGVGGQLLAQLHHYAQRRLATEQDHLKVSTEQHILLSAHCYIGNMPLLICNQAALYIFW